MARLEGAGDTDHLCSVIGGGYVPLFVKAVHLEAVGSPAVILVQQGADGDEGGGEVGDQVSGRQVSQPSCPDSFVGSRDGVLRERGGLRFGAVERLV